MKNIFGIFKDKAFEVLLRDGDLIYTTIMHGARKKLSLTCNEYCVADTIYHLSNNPSNKYGNWCYASKETIGEILGLSKQTVHKIVKKLLDEGLIEKHPITRHLKATERWYRIAVIYKSHIGKKFDPP